MSNHQIQEIKMTNVICNIVTHQPKTIEALCLNYKCKENSTICFQCLFNDHRQCRHQIVALDQIPKLLMELQNLSFDILTLQERINKHFKELLEKIESIFAPISQYKATPNLNNLNQIGQLLRKNSKQTIFNLSDSTFTQIRLLLDKHNIKLKQQVQVQKQVEKGPKQDFEFWYLKGFSLKQQNKFSEAIACLNEAIKIDPKHWKSLYWKGESLYWLKKYNEAVNSFDQSIKINPNHLHSWYYKGKFNELQIYSEAVDCYGRAISLDSNFHVNWQHIGDSLSHIGRHDEAYQCFQKFRPHLPQRAQRAQQYDWEASDDE